MIITEERRQQLIADCKREIKNTEKWLRANKAIGNPESTAISQLERQQIALAALEADAIAVTEKHEISNMEATGLYLRAWPMDRRLNDQEGYSIKLYTAPPVPVMKPVSLDKCYTLTSSVTGTVFLSKPEVIEAIRDAGYEVKE